MFCVVSNFKNQIKANINNSNGTPKADFTNANAFQNMIDPSSNHSNVVVNSSPSLSRSATTTSTSSCLTEQKPFETPVRSKYRQQSSVHGSTGQFLPNFEFYRENNNGGQQISEDFFYCTYVLNCGISAVSYTHLTLPTILRV